MLLRDGESGQSEQVIETFVDPKLDRSQLFSYPFPLPVPSEQHRIVKHLDSVQSQVAALKRAQKAAATELERLEQSILARAFRGEL